MNAVWNAISRADQAHVLQALGMDRLPDPAAMNESQRAVLAGIVGSVAADTVQRSSVAARSAPTLAAPELAVPEAGADWSSIIMKVAQVQAKMKETQMKFSAEELQVQKENVGRANKEYIEKIEEHIRQMKEAENQGFWGKLFGWIATAFIAVVAVAASVATGGVSIPLVIAAAIALTMQVLETTGTWDKMLDALADFFMDQGWQAGAMFIKKLLALDLLQTLMGMFTKGFSDWNDVKNFFADLANSLPGLNYAVRRDPDLGTMTREEVKAILSMVVIILLTVVTIGASAGVNALRSGRAAQGAVKAADAAGDVAAAAAEGAEKLTKVQRIAHYVGIGGDVGSAAATVGSSVVSVVQGFTARNAAEARAEAQEITAWLARLNQLMDEEAERLQKIMEQLNSGFVDVSDMIAGMSKAQIRIAQSL